MKQIVQNELKLLVDIIVRVVPVEKIFLFGSFATGKEHNDSDLDIFVVLKENADIREIDAMKLINKAIRDKKTMPVDIIVCKRINFNQKKHVPSIERQIAQEGMVIYG